MAQSAVDSWNFSAIYSSIDPFPATSRRNDKTSSRFHRRGFAAVLSAAALVDKRIINRCPPQYHSISFRNGLMEWSRIDFIGREIRIAVYLSIGHANLREWRLLRDICVRLMHTEHVWNTAMCVDLGCCSIWRQAWLRFAANCAISMDCSEFRWRMRFGKELVRVIVAKSRVKWQMRSKSFDIWQNILSTNEKIILKINFREFYS